MKPKEKTEVLRFKPATTVGCPALLSAVFAAGAQAGERNRKTVITFSGPLEIPGVHLEAWGVLAAAHFVAQLRQVPIMAVRPSGEAVPLPEAVTPPASRTAEATLSLLPLTAVFGLKALGGACALRFTRKRLLQKDAGKPGI